MERRLATILSADVVQYSCLMAQDEEATLRALGDSRDVIARVVAGHAGRMFGVAGDSLMVEFQSPVQALRAAVAIQRALNHGKVASNEISASRCTASPRIRFRIGINLGDVVARGEDLFGDGVNVAARLQEMAKPGGICISRAVQDFIGGRLSFPLCDLGERVLKHIARPVQVYRVDWLRDEPSHATGGADAGFSPPKPSIAVLPFLNMSGDPEQEYFADGITEDVITDLSKISGLRVIARNTVFTYKGKPVKMPLAAQELGVQFLLEGSVRKAGSRVRVTGQLIDGTDGAHLWADRYDRDFTDIFAIQDEITHAIVEQLKVKLLPEEKMVVDHVPTGSVEAYGYYLRGREFLHRHWKTYYLLAKRMFSKAIELDPHYARAYAGIADCDSFLFLHYNADVSIDGILAASAKALELEAGLAEAHASRGLALSLSGRYLEAMVEFEQAIAFDPNLFEASYFYARACFTQGQIEKAAQLFQRAAEIKPDDYQALLVLVGVLRSLGRMDEMKAAARKGVQRAERELTLHPANPRPAYLGAVGLAALGEIDRAKDWAARALAIDPDDGLMQYNVACFYSLVGEHDRAIELLIGLLPTATRERREWVKKDSDLDPIRSHPRFPEVLAMLD